MGSWVGGGVVECAASQPVWLPYVEVSDVAVTTKRATGLGGEVLIAPREGPKGWRSVVATPNGGDMALWQPKQARR
jgi:predicted enzyme related to lactoylglutathione lyase